MNRTAWSLALATCSLITAAPAQDRDTSEPPGPPIDVVLAWENGLGDLLPGPPVWVLEMRAGMAPEGSGPPPWIAARHARAQSLGLSGPPPEVLEAWASGEGAYLPGPPDFVFDFLAAGEQDD